MPTVPACRVTRKCRRSLSTARTELLPHRRLPKHQQSHEMAHHRRHHRHPHPLWAVSPWACPSKSFRPVAFRRKTTNNSRHLNPAAATMCSENHRKPLIRRRWHVVPRLKFHRTRWLCSSRHHDRNKKTTTGWKSTCSKRRKIQFHAMSRDAL